MAVKWFGTLWPAGGVLSATFLIAWATEVLSFFLSRGLAFAVLALLQVLPEFAVEAEITRSAAGSVENLKLVTANFTGANRLIVGLFVPLVYFMAWGRARRLGQRLSAVQLPVESSIEVVALVIPTLYSFTFVLRGNLSLVDAVLLFAIYAAYLFIVYRLPPQEEHDEPLPLVPRKIREQKPSTQKWIVALFFVVGGALLFFSVHPFVENTKALGAVLGIPAYFLLQWIAPFLSEFPEFVTILYWGRSGRAQLGLTNAISSKVNQWTLLIAMIPVVYVFSTWQLGHVVWTLEFSESQRLEILLTAAQGLFAAAALVNLRFQRWEAFTLLSLWAFQLLDPVIDPYILRNSPWDLPYVFQPAPHETTGELIPHYVREWTTWAYLALTPVALLSTKNRWAAFKGFRQVVRTNFGRKTAAP
jgi:cation:H+ antiporter